MSNLFWSKIFVISPFKKSSILSSFHFTDAICNAQVNPILGLKVVLLCYICLWLVKITEEPGVGPTGKREEEGLSDWPRGEGKEPGEEELRDRREALHPPEREPDAPTGTFCIVYVIGTLNSSVWWFKFCWFCLGLVKLHQYVRTIKTSSLAPAGAPARFGN